MSLLRLLQVNRTLKFILTLHLSQSMGYSTLFRQRNIFLKVSGLLRDFKNPFSINFFKLSVSKPYLDSDVSSDCNSSTKQTVPDGIRMGENGQMILSGELIGALPADRLNHMLNEFNLKALKPQYLDKYQVMLSENMNFLFFPLNGKTGDVLGVQYLNSGSDYKALSENVFTGDSDFVLFGWPIKSLKQDTLVITSNPVDAVAANQETDAPAVALSCKNSSLTSQLFSILEQFQQIILWFHSEHHSWQVHKLFVEKLGKKVSFIRPESWLTPLLCLQKGLDLNHILTQAYPLKHDAVETFCTYKEEVYNQFLNHEKYSGAKWKRYHVLNELLKGLRLGELTIFSGQTGTGKTTFMSEYSLDLCMQGMPTLWGSFEITNTRLIKTMFTQFSQCSLKDNLERIPVFASKFNKLPMFFMSFDGNHTIKYVIEAMSHAVIVHKIQHVVIDNLQFMMNVEDLNSTIDHLRRQDQIFSAFRKFATHYNCHVTLVMHPRKEPEFTELNSTSISGSAKAMQEADNIIILQTTKTRQYLQVTKNRFDGEKGCVLLDFNKDTLTFHIKKPNSNQKSKRV